MRVSLSKLREFVMDREARRAVIHGVAKSRTWLSDWRELNKLCYCPSARRWLKVTGRAWSWEARLWVHSFLPFGQEVLPPSSSSIEHGDIVITSEGSSLATMYSFVFQSLSLVWLFATPWTAARQAPLSSTASLSLLKLVHWVSNAIQPPSSVVLFSSCPQSFPAWGSFPVSQLFALSGQSIGTSASVLPMNIQDWFPLGLASLISLQSKRLSRVFSNTTVQKHHILWHSAFFMVQLSHPYMTVEKPYLWLYRHLSAK